MTDVKKTRKADYVKPQVTQVRLALEQAFGVTCYNTNNNASFEVCPPQPSAPCAFS